MPKWQNSRRKVGSWLGGYDREKGSERETGLEMARSANVISCCLLRGCKMSVSKFEYMDYFGSDMAVYDY